MDNLRIWDVVVAFMVGQLVLGFPAWVVWRSFHRTPDLAGRLSAVKEYVSRRRRVERARRELERARAEQGAVRKLMARAQQIVQDRIEVIDSAGSMATTISFGLATAILFEGDAALFTLLNGGSLLFGLSFTVWAFFSPWIACALFTFGHFLASATISDEDRPGRTLKRARVCAIVMGLLVVVGLWASLSGRGVDLTQASWAAEVIQFGIWVLTLALAACGSFTAIVASVSYQQARIASQLIALETLDDEYTRHIRGLMDEIAKYDTLEPADAESVSTSTAGPSPTPHLPTPVAPTIGRPTAAVVVFLALSVGAWSGATASAEDRSPAQSSRVSGIVPSSTGNHHPVVPRWLGEPATPAAEECENLLDVSGSMGDGGRRQAAEAFGRMIPLLLGAFPCRVMRISAFSADVPGTAIEEFTVPPLKESIPCPAVRSTSGIPALAGFMYPGLREREKRETESRCRDRQRAEEARLAASRTDVINDIVAAVGRLSSTPTRGKCTAVHQVTTRAMQRSPYVFVVTDGDSTCRWFWWPNGAPFSVNVPGSSTVVFLLVPTASERNVGSDEVLDRAAALKVVFPGSIVRLLSEATPAFWRAVGSSRTEK